MIRNKEKIIQENTGKIAELVKSYVDDMDKMSDTQEFTIDNIERLWGEMNGFAKEVYREISNEIIEQINEKEIIRVKKGSTKRKV